jgi:hypothetical protein
MSLWGIVMLLWGIVGSLMRIFFYTVCVNRKRIFGLTPERNAGSIRQATTPTCICYIDIGRAEGGFSIQIFCIKDKQYDVRL